VNLSEFKAWFEGFTEDMNGPPSERQWKRIKKRVSEITSDPTPWPVFVNTYVRPYPYWNWGTYGGTMTGTVTSNNSSPQITSNAAFIEAGRAEASHTAEQ